MKKVLILAEGQTEETFIKKVLAPHLRTQGVEPIPKVVVTKRVSSGGQFKGGITSYQKVVGNLRRLLGDTSAALVTTLIDFYGLPEDFPGKASLSAGGCYQRVAHLEREFTEDIAHPRFAAHLALHEFEALVFADPARCATVFPDASVAPRLEQVRAQFGNPEEINEGAETAPSKRIKKILPGYRKELHGPQAVGEIGLPGLRKHCKHFDAWLTRLESVAKPIKK